MSDAFNYPQYICADDRKKITMDSQSRNVETSPGIAIATFMKNYRCSQMPKV